MGGAGSRALHTLRKTGLAAMIVAGMCLPTSAQEKQITIELNDAADVSGACRLVFVAVNGTGVVLEKTSFDVVTFDSTGKVGQSLTFQFGRLPVGKTRVVQFDLPGQACATISRLLVNDVSECAVDGKASELCLDALSTSTRTAIEFGL
jgi:hypothetical protein